MGGVFLRRDHKPRTEVINDRNGDVANLFRILQRHYPQFMETLKFQITSRREFQRLAASDPSTLTGLERAARFLYLQRLTFGGKVTGQSFGVDKDGGGRFNVTRLGPVLEDIHERMAGVVIEQLDWRDFLKRWDRPGMLFYLDPPYYRNEDDYGTGMFSRTDFEEMAKALKRLKGSFKLSLNDLPEVREIFEGFDIEAVNCTYSISGGAGSGSSLRGDRMAGLRKRSVQSLQKYLFCGVANIRRAIATKLGIYATPASRMIHCRNAAIFGTVILSG